MRRHSSAWVLALVAGLFVVVPPSGVAADEDPALVATRALRSDAEGTLNLDSDAAGRVRFAGVGAGGSIDNPLVDVEDTVRSAARAHLDRYGASLGAARGTTYVQSSSGRSVAGTRLVRYQQQIDGVPVLGGQVVLGLDSDRDLRSVAADVTSTAGFGRPEISAEAAAATALGLSRRAHPDAVLTATDRGRWVLDPAVVGLVVPGGVRTVRQFEVGDGAGIRDLALIDDRSGQVVFRTNLIQNADRVVCDRANVRGAESQCASPFDRVEGQTATGVTDVDDAYDFSGETSDFYQEVGGIDLTAELGFDVAGTRRLASTVRYCSTNVNVGCPYANAFWNGVQMYYGDGFAAADDIVGHEMTHGFVDQHSKLFYWGQSGAINESMADVVGEIVDHRNGADDDSAWGLGEDLTIGPFRSMQDPTSVGDPDSMTSPNYTADDSGPQPYDDAGGVHQNSGVGNKTAYLISQGTGGGAFNGQTFAGIDAGDPMLTKTGKLYLDVIQKLPSGADYADLAAQLDQSCADLRATATPGFSAASCAIVHQAGLATRLTTNPPQALHDTDADTSCPIGTVKRVLLDSEAAPTTKFAPFDLGWSRETVAGTSNATSGTGSWFAVDPETGQANLLRSVPETALPLGQQSFLSFESWYLLDYDGTGFYDGVTVEMGVDGGEPAVTSTNGYSWVNGPDRTLHTLNPPAGQPAFAGDSRGWSISRLDLTSRAGHTVRPQFTMRSDNVYGAIGLYLDDIRIYTCDEVPGAPATVTGAGAVKEATIRWAAPTVNAGSVTGYRIHSSDGRIALVNTAARRVRMKWLRAGALTFTVQARGPGGYLSPVRSVRLGGTATSLAASRQGAKVTLSGLLKKDGVKFTGRRVVLERRSGSTWVVVGSALTNTRGIFTRKVTRTAAATYRARYAGGAGVMGALSVVRRR